MPKELIPYTFMYRNHRGEVAERHVIPISPHWGSTEWHPEPQWLLQAYDLDRAAIRDFAMDDILGGKRDTPAAPELPAGYIKHTPGDQIDMMALPKEQAWVRAQLRSGHIVDDMVRNLQWSDGEGPTSNPVVGWKPMP